MENQPSKPTIRLKPAAPKAPGANETIKLRPSGTPAAQPPPQASAQTIRLQTPSAPVAAPIPGQHPMPAPEVSTNTARVPLMQGVAGSQPTMITTPDFGEPSQGAFVETATAVVNQMNPQPAPRNTINLKTVAGPVSTAPVTPASPTINLKVPQAEMPHEDTNISNSSQTLNLKAGQGPKTLQLKKPGSASSAAPTLKLSSVSKNPTSSGSASSTRDEALPSDDDVVPFARFDAKKLKVVDDGTTGAMPHAIIASVAFLALAFVTYAVIAQFVNLYMYGSESQETSAIITIDNKKFQYPFERPDNEYWPVPGFTTIGDVKAGKADK